MDWLYGLDSASFSVARCSRPMCGSAFWITSPSISNTRRSTPCAAGCWGPKFSVKLRISATGGASSLFGQRIGSADGNVLELLLVAVVFADDTRHQRARLDAHRLVHHTALGRVVLHLDVADQREVATERMADETVVGQQAAQIGVTLEQDAEQIERLTLVPVGRGPDRVHRIDQRRLTRRGETAQAQAPVVSHRQQLIDHGESPLRGWRADGLTNAVDATAE